ncbi:response regulator [Pokkaliibacter sp. CJK22405]|uniref:response regulator n=1 Tax=Pokkaliibacter sp. CJK22405 TaxID=3384615 RepID=UPI003985108B
MKNHYSIVLIDDHALVRAGIRSLIDDLEGFDVCAEGSSVDEAMSLIETHRPELLLLDIALKGGSGLDVLAQLESLEESQRPLVIVMSMYTSRDFVVGAIRAGARGYLPKEAASVELELALQRVIQGDVYLSASVTENVLQPLYGNQNPPAEAKQSLTPRQKEILVYIAKGYSTKEIAWSLTISPKTVEAHRMQMMERLNIKDIPNLVIYAIRQGLVSI